MHKSTSGGEHQSIIVRLIRGSICATGLLAGFCPSNGVLAAPVAEPVYLKESEFSIPVQMAPNKAGQIREMRLYVSTDRGKNWTLMKSVPPTETSFKFKSRADGEYWFTLAYVDQAGKIEPADVRKEPPGLRVVIDTKAPTVNLRPLPVDNGQAGAAWKMSDDKLDLTSFKLEIKSASESAWREIRVPRMSEGQGEWSADPGVDYQIRATVRDQAGNETVAQADLPAERGKPTRSAVDDAAAINREPTPIPKARPNNEVRRPLADEPAPRELASDDGNFNIPSPPAVNAGKPAVREAVRPPADPEPARRLAADLDASPPAPRRTERSVVEHSTRYQPTNPERIMARGTTEPAVRPATVEHVVRPLPDTAARIPVASTSGNVAQASASATAPERPRPAPVKIPLINSARFAVDYEVRGVGPAGIGKVELYYTKDNGQSWKLYGEDPDKTPPFEVQLPGEGRFGLRVVVTSPAGYGQRPPQKGDNPHMIVEVDTTAPQADLYQPMPDPNAPNEALLISWSASDAHIAPKPVSLFYAKSPDGPWEPIKSDLPASGQLSWRVPANVPSEVFLRLVARDLGNNVSVAETKQPVLVDLSKPEAEVIGIAILPDGNPVR